MSSVSSRVFRETEFTPDRKAFFLPLEGGSPILDTADVEEAERFQWKVLVDKKTGARRVFRWGRHGEPRNVYMHRHLMNALPGQFVDHVNRNALDNRRDNLRLCTKAQNAWNSRRNIKGKTSQFKGVSRHKKCVPGRPWLATITVSGKQVFLGHHATEILAAEAYDEAAVRLFGSFALTNFQRRDNV